MAQEQLAHTEAQRFALVQNVAEMQNQVADLKIEVEVWQVLAHQGQQPPIAPLTAPATPDEPSGNFQYRKAQQQPYKPSAPPTNNNNNNNAAKDRRCYNCGQPGHYIIECPKPRQNKQGENSGIR
jgi:hypothetical protein